MRALFIFWLGAALASASLSAAAFDLSDARRLVSLNEGAVSPDGSRVAYVRGKLNFAEDRTDRDVMLVDVRTHAQRQLTYDRKGIGNLQWSHDGRTLYFIAQDNDEKDPEAQLFALPMNGGDAREVTSAKTGVSDYAISPDGRRVAYLSDDENPHQKEIDAHRDAFEVGDNDYLRREAQMPTHVWLQALAGGKARRLTSGSWSTANPSWSPDGRSIAFQYLPTPYVGDSLGARAETVDVATGARRAVDAKTLENAPMFAPGRGYVAYLRNSGGDYTRGVDAYIVDRRGSVLADFRRSVDRNVDAYQWDGTGRGIYIVTPDGTTRTLWYQPVHGRARRVNTGTIVPAFLNSAARDGSLLFVGNAPGRPGELYLWNGRSTIALTHDNAFVARTGVARTVPVTWRATKGPFEEDGVLTYPLHVSGNAPLVLLIHGGPQGASGTSWSTLRQEMAARGYYVFEPNYRGSTNLGDAYSAAIANDAGDGPGKDVMAGIAKVESLAPIDRSRIAVSGWSYGGYMTSWLIGHYHFWKTAVSGASLDDWLDDFNLAFYVYTDVPFFRGVPWNPKYTQEWIEQSPITYAPQITTPTLIMGDVGDDNVVITNSYRLYHAMRDNGQTAEFVAYPVSGHHPSDPVRSEDVNRRWLAWLDKYLK